MKIGDRVKVARMSEYDLMVHRAQKIPLPIGETGTVVDFGYSRSHGDIVTVLMDKSGNKAIWCQKHLDVIK